MRHYKIGDVAKLVGLPYDTYDVTVTVYNGIKAAMKLHVEPMAK